MGGSINDTKIKDPSLAVAGCAQCTITDPTVVIGGSTFYKIDGNPLPQAPKYTMNLTARYGIPMGAGAEVFFYTDWVYRSEVNFFLYKSTEYRGKALVEGGLRAGYGWGSGKYEASVFGHNITNKVRRRGWHRRQQPDRLHQRPAHRRRAVQDDVLTRPAVPHRQRAPRDPFFMGALQGQCVHTPPLQFALHRQIACRVRPPADPFLIAPTT